jgi:aryl-alcohol dehydrogenase-like predicted oxidoreductase
MGLLGCLHCLLNLRMNNRIILGTAQFGSKYGINKAKQRPTQKEVFDILDIAVERNIESVDTADNYGNSIELLGLYQSRKQETPLFKILSKFEKIPQGRLYKHVTNSLKILHIPYFEVYSFHSFGEYLQCPYLKNELLSLKSKGYINKIGISIYTNLELQQVIKDVDIDVIQMPYNLLDNQNIRDIYIDQAKQANKEIHIRSVFLQGLLFLDENTIPNTLISLKPYINKIRLFCENESISIRDLALSYALYNNKQIDKVIIGVNSKAQLLEDIEPMNYLKKGIDFINQQIHVKETDFLFPVNW